MPLECARMYLLWLCFFLFSSFILAVFLCCRFWKVGLWLNIVTKNASASNFKAVQSWFSPNSCPGFCGSTCKRITLACLLYIYLHGNYERISKFTQGWRFQCQRIKIDFISCGLSKLCITGNPYGTFIIFIYINLFWRLAGL